MVNGPLAVQQQIFKPPFYSNQLQQVYSKSYEDNSDSGYGIPNKQLYQPPQMIYQKQESPYYQPAPTKSSKYAELFSNPAPPLPNYSFGGGIDMFPVDVVNSIPSSSTATKFEPSADKQTAPAPSNVDLESMMFGKPDLDLGSLLSMLTPDNKPADSQASDSSSYLIPNLDFLSEPSPQQTTSSESFESTSPASMQQPFAVSVMENSNTLPSMVEEQTFWEGADKEARAPTFSSASSLPLSLNSATPAVDPFMTELLNDEPLLRFPADESRYDQAATPTSDIFQAGLSEDHGSPPGSAQLSPVTPASGAGAMAITPWNNNLQDLFEKTIDLSDMMELDFMLPPPAKRHSAHDVSLSREREKEWAEQEASPKAVKVEPASPPAAKSPAVTSPIEVDASSERGGGGKSKSTILFGKHEDEIIHKLISPRPGAHAKPVSRDKLVSMPVEEFNQLLEQASLSEIEVAFMKEWRRRGKNKAAAQIARKRKREEVTDLEGEVKGLRKQKAELSKKYDRLRSQIASLKKRSMSAEDRVYRQQTRLTGKPVSRDSHLIHLTDDDKLLLVPRISSQILTIKE